jgi:radical SAM protein with 4Fe4S-binding SPASM domain
MSVNDLATAGQNFHARSARQDPAWVMERGESYRRYRRMWNVRPQNNNPGSFPLHLDIETTNMCNLKCIMCPRTIYLDQGDWRWSPNGLGLMDMGLYSRLLDQASENGAYSVKLNLLGEPLMHPELPAQVAYAKRRNLMVMINTNAVLLTEQTSVRLLEAGVDDVFFSLDSADPETFERVRPGARFDVVKTNVQNFIRLKNSLGHKHVRTRASMVADVLEPTHSGEVDAFHRMMAELGVDEVGVGPMDDHTVDHSRDNVGLCGFTCEQLYQRMFITWDGAILPCCGHLARGYVIGSALDMDLADAWYNAKYKTLRKAHENDRFWSIPICRSCSVPYLDNLNRLKNDTLKEASA